MKKLIAFISLFLPLVIFSQSVAINTDGTVAHSSAIMDIKSTLKGFLVPRMNTGERTTIPGPAIGLTVFDMDTYSYWMYRGDLNGGWIELQHSLQNFWEGSGSNIYTKNNGNVGIGTNNPAEKLSINAADPTISFLIANATKGFIQAAADNMRVGTYNANLTGNLVLATRNVDRMTILADGKVGIGTTVPVSKFHITGGVDAALNTHGYMMIGLEAGTNVVFDNNEILARNNGNTSSLYLQNSGGNVYIGDATNFTSVHKLGVDGNTVITGNLRVGTTPTPSGYKLAVDGKVICTELLVKLVANWPDYVFRGSHILLTIEELELFIKNNKHLPGIPAAAAIESSGLNIGEMQKLQMEKIEELTLYIIQLKKEIEKLKAGR
jgi:hypothetical protein